MKRSYKDISYDEFYYQYITLNQSTQETANALNISCTAVRRLVTLYNTKKTKEAILEQHKRTFLKLYGVDNPSKCEAIKRKKEETCLKNFGVKYSFQSNACREKTKQTLKEKYGEDIINVGQATQIKKRVKITKKERYGNENYVNSEKAKQTCLEKYGVEHPAQAEEIKEKTKQVIKERYNTDHIMHLEEYKIKCIENSKKNTLKKYGVTNVVYIPEVQEKIKKSWQKKSKEQLDEIVSKRVKTQKANGTINASKPEEEIYSLLTSKFDDVKRQYKNKKYPFFCDFYIPKLDLYIEYQGYWTHGFKPFDINDLKDQERLQRLKNKEFFHAIKIWTQRDPLKRETAHQNGLNWIEFFNMDQFMEWYKEV